MIISEQSNKRIICIDINVFLNLLNEHEINEDKHINHLLKQLQAYNFKLLVDDKRKITTEYKEWFKKFLKNKSDTLRKYMLLYWINPLNHCKIVMDTSKKNELLNIIKRIITNRGADRVYVFVAFETGSILISNDLKDIISYRDELKRETRKIVKSKVSSTPDVMCSQEAYDILQQCIAADTQKQTNS